MLMLLTAVCGHLAITLFAVFPQKSVPAGNIWRRFVVVDNTHVSGDSIHDQYCEESLLQRVHRLVEAFSFGQADIRVHASIGITTSASE